MMILVAFDVYEIDRDGQVFCAPMGLYTDIEIAQLACEMHYKASKLEWRRVDDTKNLRMLWEGTNDLGAVIVRIVPVPLNSMFAHEGRILDYADR